MISPAHDLFKEGVDMIKYSPSTRDVPAWIPTTILAVSFPRSEAELHAVHTDHTSSDLLLISGVHIDESVDRWTYRLKEV